MAEFLTFSLCLNKLMQKHGLTPNQLCSSIGCSRSELKQLLTSEGTEAKRNQIFEQLKACHLFLPEDLWALEQSLLVSKIGLDRYCFQQAIEQILTGTPPQGATDMVSSEGTSLSQLCETYLDADEVDILCFNSCFPGLMQAIRPLFQDPHRKVRMWHLISSEAVTHRSASLVAISLPLLFDKRYQPYVIYLSNDAGISPVGGNMFSIRGIFGGEKKESFVSAVNESTFYELPNASACGMFQFTANLFRAIRSALSPLKEQNNPKGDFTSLCMTFLSHELNRATYALANGLCFHQIPCDIAVSALGDTDFFSEEEAAELIRRTISIHEQRYQNLYHKRKPGYMIMTQNGCRQFLDSGINQDHFAGFRPFTPEERKVIFSAMLDAAEQNPFFTPLLMKDPQFRYRYNLECYDKLGVSLDITNTDYDLHNGYQPVFLMFADFTRGYLAYYLETLVNERCFNRETSLRLLHEMYHDFLNRFDLNA